MRRAMLLCVGVLVAVNLSVSVFGRSNGFLLSPFHFWDKTRALGYLAVHQVRRLGSPELPDPRHTVRRYAARHGVPVQLALAVARAESAFIPTRISATGAMGVMQIMPDTARLMSVSDPFHPVDNIDGGVRYLAQLWRRYRGDMRRTVAAYNTGPGRVPRTGEYRVPNETAAYVNTVLRYARQY